MSGVNVDGVVGIALQDQTVLLIRRSEHVVAPLADCLPGGAIESGESEERALRREFLEELGADVSPQRRLWQSITPWDVRLAWWLVELGDDPLQPNPLEVHSFRWVKLEEAERLPSLLESNRHFFQAWRRGEFTIEG